MGEQTATDATTRIVWRTDGLTLEIAAAESSAPALTAIVTGSARVEFDGVVPLVHVLAAGYGHSQASGRLIQTDLGRDLRYVEHHAGTAADSGVETLTVVLATEASGLRATLRLESYPGTAVVRSHVEVENVGQRALTVQSVTSWAAGFGSPSGSAAEFGSWDLVEGRSDWLAEGRWDISRLRGDAFPVIRQELTGHQPRGSHSVVSKGSWSSGANLPVAGVVSDELDIAWLWQIEHNGAWRWEVGENTRDGYVALSGPTELDHDWRTTLRSGEAFSSVPVSVALGSDLVDAAAQLTTHRRADRRDHADNSAMPVVFNDYMNTLDGDPTTEKLLPLIDAAAEVGAEVFCIDAGWYDDGGDWWDSVGEWTPSTVRFPGGLGEVIERIHAHGMVPGLWLEPEVVGVRSPVAETLPFDAFFQRDGARIVEHDRYHLDLRHPAAVAHLDQVVDRLVADFGVGFFKFDYNIDPGAGTDLAAESTGAGLLGHNRAHLAWLDGLAERHPTLVIENCASGAMRTDWAVLSRLQLQSTSDQQDFLLYPPIAATAPLSMLPEQAASWAYPQPEMSDEHVALCLATGLLGRFYVSGYLNRMTGEQRSMVSEAIGTAKALRARIARSAPVWPLGLPGWDDPWVALGLVDGSSTLVTVWKRTAEAGGETLSFPSLVGQDIVVDTVFPTTLPVWDTTWDADTGTLHILAPTATEAARTIELRPAERAEPDSAPPTE